MSSQRPSPKPACLKFRGRNEVHGTRGLHFWDCHHSLRAVSIRHESVWLLFFENDSVTRFRGENKRAVSGPTRIRPCLSIASLGEDGAACSIKVGRLTVIFGAKGELPVADVPSMYGGAIG